MTTAEPTTPETNTETPTEAPKAPVVPPQADKSAETIARLEKELSEARAEAGKQRVNAKEKAAQDARDDLIKELGKTLGFVKDGEDADPKELRAQIEESNGKLRQSEINNAVLMATAGTGIDQRALLRLGDFTNVDPSDSKSVQTAVDKAVEDWPILKTKTDEPRRPKASGTENTGGSGESAVTPEQFKAMDYEQRVALFQSNRALYDKLSGR